MQKFPPKVPYHQLSNHNLEYRHKKSPRSPDLQGRRKLATAKKNRKFHFKLLRPTIPIIGSIVNDATEFIEIKAKSHKLLSVKRLQAKRPANTPGRHNIRELGNDRKCYRKRPRLLRAFLLSSRFESTYGGIQNGFDGYIVLLCSTDAI